MSIDHRFYLPKGALDLKAVAELTSAELRGDGAIEVHGIASASAALAGEVCFYQGTLKEASGVSEQASACFVTGEIADALPKGVAALIVDNPRFAHTLLGDALFHYPMWYRDEAVSGPAAISESAKIGPGATIAPGAAIGHDTEIGRIQRLGRVCRLGATAGSEQTFQFNARCLEIRSVFCQARVSVKQVLVFCWVPRGL